MLCMNEVGFPLDAFNLSFSPPFASPTYSYTGTFPNIIIGGEKIGVQNLSTGGALERVLITADWKKSPEQAFIRELFFTPRYVYCDIQNRDDIYTPRVFYYPSPAKRMSENRLEVWNNIVHAWQFMYSKIVDIFMTKFSTYRDVRAPILFPIPYNWMLIDPTKLAGLAYSRDYASSLTTQNTTRTSTKGFGEVGLLPNVKIFMAPAPDPQGTYQGIFNEIEAVINAPETRFVWRPVDDAKLQFERTYSVTLNLTTRALLTQEFWAVVAYDVWRRWSRQPSYVSALPWEYQNAWLRTFARYCSGLSSVFCWWDDPSFQPQLSKVSELVRFLEN